MSNVDRRYAYYDDGNLPTTGEYGVTYLTLFSSGAGNKYDGWIFDPDHKIPESLIERSFGFRNPTQPQYCWDDEITVDLSNPQSREESEMEQGRITSFNTNVSSLPILLEDTDISGMSESEREAKAKTVLFSAIPLIKDAFIHAEVEIAMKMNISPSNTNGRVRLEAFYILNDESDRTMRPHPINHYSVRRENEYDILRLLYWNPTLKHETNNYIGVKLLCSGGTAEIGISDNPNYGDGIITLVSGGLNGDVIYSGQPRSLEIFGLDEVPIGYKLNPDDYTVLCTYDTDEVYEVTKLCDFNPEMWTKIVDPTTILTATYQGLTASMSIETIAIDHIELLGKEVFRGDSYTISIDDYTVLAYAVNGDVFDVTEDSTFSPAIGTTITRTTTLTATYTVNEIDYTDSLSITKATVVQRNGDANSDITYTLYSDGCLVISGVVSNNYTYNGDIYDEDSILLSNRRIVNTGTTIATCSGYRVDGWGADNVSLGSVSGTSAKGISITNNPLNPRAGYIGSGYNPRNFYVIDLAPWGDSYVNGATTATNLIKSIEYDVVGKPLAIVGNSSYSSGSIIEALSSKITYDNGKVKYINFENIDTSEVRSLAFLFHRQPYSDFSWIVNKKFPKLLDVSYMFAHCGDNCLAISDDMFENTELKQITGMFAGYSHDTLPNFVEGIDVSEVKIADYVFANSMIEGTYELRSWRLDNVLATASMFEGCAHLTNLYYIEDLGMYNNIDFGKMFYNCTALESIGNCLVNWDSENCKDGFGTGNGESIGLKGMFYNCREVDRFLGAGSFIAKVNPSGDNRGVNLSYMFQNCLGITNFTDFTNAITNKVYIVRYMFHNCPIESLDGCSLWNVSSITYAEYFMTAEAAFTSDEAVNPVLGWTLTSLVNPSYMFGMPYFYDNDRPVAVSIASKLQTYWTQWLPMHYSPTGDEKPSSILYSTGSGGSPRRYYNYVVMKIYGLSSNSYTNVRL